jgi:hypothetical protein
MNHEFIEFKIPPEMLADAVAEGKKLGQLRNSITRGEGNTAGLLGEMVAEKVTGYSRKNTRDYDLVNPNDPNDTADVKTKRCSSAPEPHFENSIASYNTSQKCRKYIFVRINKDYSTAWVCGELTKEDYFKKAVFIQQGQFDPSNNWRAKADCYNVSMEDLDPPTILEEKQEKKE